MANTLNHIPYFVMEVTHDGKKTKVITDGLFVLTHERVKRLIESASIHLNSFTESFIEDHNKEVEEKHHSRVPPGKKDRKIITGHVYLMKWNGIYKIGRSVDCFGRLKAMHHNNPGISLVGYHESKDCFKDEENWHFHFGIRRKHGEWFSLTKDDVKFFMEGAMPVSWGGK